MKRLPFLLLLLAAPFLGCGPTLTPDTSLGQQAQGSHTVPIAGLMPRNNFTLTTLTDGRVLAAGSLSGFGWPQASAELYDPATNTWSPTGSMAQARGGHAAVLLPDGRVLVAGGTSFDGVVLSSMELYDPTTGTWSAAGELPLALTGLISTTLPDGRVLMLERASTSALLFDPATLTWTLLPPRHGNTTPTLTLLPDGRVLVAGYPRAELFDPTTSTWTQASASTQTERHGHAATLLADGRVLLTGGSDDAGAWLTTAALYDPATDTFTATGSMARPRAHHRSVPLPDGTALVLGGRDDGYSALQTVERFDPTTGTFSTRVPLVIRRMSYEFVRLGDGRLLLVGGRNATYTESPDYTSEVYDPEYCYTSCSDGHAECGALSDGCGGTLECGTCGTGLSCTENHCGDITPPVVTVLTPRPDVYLSNTVLVNVTATDGVQVFRAEFYAGNTRLGNTMGPGPYSWSWDTRSFPASRITVKVYDNSSNEAVVNQDVTVRNGSPTTALRDPTRQVPACNGLSSSCGSGSLLTGRAHLGPEPSAPGTLDASCADGTSGTFHVDESLDALKVSTLDATPLAVGRRVKVEATVWASSLWASDVLELYSASDAGNPTWKPVATLRPSQAGGNVLSTTFVLPEGERQVIRGVFSRGGSAGPCAPAGDYDDRDDLLFFVDTEPDPEAPSVQLTSPVHGATVGNTVTLQAAASDTFGVTQVDFYVDGQKLGSDTTEPFTYAWATRSWDNGSHTLTATAHDFRGNASTSQPVQLTLDNDKTAPTLALTSPESGATVSGNVNVQVTASDNVAVTEVRLLVDGVLTSSVTGASLTSVFLPWNTESSANGVHTLTTVALDAAGNATTSTAVPVSVDNDVTAPTVVLTSPENGATVFGSVALAASASDNVGVTRVDFYLDGTLLGSDTTAPYTYTWNSTSSVNGPHTLLARAYDLWGNVGTSPSVSVALTNDQTPPTVSLSAPAQGAIVFGGVDLSATASDNMRVTRVEFYVDGTLLATDTTSPYTHTWDSTASVDGTHTLMARAYDQRDNVGTSTSVQVTLDNKTPPSVVLTEPGAGSTVNGTVTLLATASDASGVSRVEFYVDGTLLGTDTTAPFYSSTWDTLPWANGSHTLTARAYDVHGTMSTSPSVSVTVFNDKTAPTVSVTAPTSGSTVSGMVLVSASASDNVGVTQVEFYAGSTLLGRTAGATPFQLNWDTLTTAENGAVTVRARAFDAAGNTSESSVTVTVNNPNVATYDATLRAPKCGTRLTSCDSGPLLFGRASLGPERNQPNTLNGSCPDGASGVYHSEASLDALKVSTTDGRAFAKGKTVRLEATFWASSNYASERVDLYYAPSASSPVWTYLTTLTPTGSGRQMMAVQYTLPAGSLQAVRGVLRNSGSASTCPGGSFTDVDDLAFVTQ